MYSATFLTLINANSANWTRISGSFGGIQHEGAVDAIPTFMGTGFTSDGSDFGYLFGGSQQFFGLRVTDHLYRINLNKGNVTRISGSAVFDSIPPSLPSKHLCLP